MAKMFQIVNAMVILQPSPVLQISTGATQSNQGKYAYAMSGINIDQVYTAATKLAAAMQSRPRSVRDGFRGFVHAHAKPSDQPPA